MRANGINFFSVEEFANAFRTPTNGLNLMKETIIQTRMQVSAVLGWLLLFAAICFEVCGTVSMKLAEGFTRPVPSVLMFVFYLLCLATLEFAIQSLELNVVYAVWSGVGTALIALIGICWFKEPVTVLKVICFALIILGVVGLNLKWPRG